MASVATSRTARKAIRKLRVIAPVQCGFHTGLTFPRAQIRTNPNPVDQLFDHLPPTLLNLSLCYWRHLYHEFLIPYRPMDPSEGPRFALLLGSMEMCRLLRRSQTPMLTRLTLEYRAADGDDELLDYIAQTYPCLAYLKFIRYRPHGATYVDVVSNRS